MKNKKGSLDLLSIVVILAGIGLIVLSGIYATKSKIPFKNTVYTDATVTKVEGNDVYVKYEVGGLMRQKKISLQSNKYVEKQNIRIYYNKKKPEKLHIDTSTNTSHKLSKIGTVIIVLGIILLIIRVKKKNYRNNLRVSGRRIAATIQELKVNKNIVKNGKNPYIVVCTWTNPEDNKTYTFNSPKVWGNPSELINIKNITTLTVYVDKKDFNKYIMDVTQLK